MARTFEEAVEAWLRRGHVAAKGSVDVHSIEVTHEDGWVSDAGTGYPAEVNVSFKVTKIGATGQVHTKRHDAYGGDPVTFMRQLFEEE